MSYMLQHPEFALGPKDTQRLAQGLLRYGNGTEGQSDGHRIEHSVFEGEGHAVGNRQTHRRSGNRGATHRAAQPMIARIRRSDALCALIVLERRPSARSDLENGAARVLERPAPPLAQPQPLKGLEDRVVEDGIAHPQRPERRLRSASVPIIPPR